MRILVKHDSIGPKLRFLAQYWKNPRSFCRVCSRAMLNDTQAFFTEKNSTFWNRIGESFKDTHDDTTPRISATGQHAAILIHKIEGGTVFPKPPHTRLAIPTPNNPKREKWPNEYQDGQLVPMFGKNGLYGLADAKGIRKEKRATARAKRRTEKWARQVANENGIRGAASKAFMKAQKRLIAAGAVGRFNEMRNNSLLFWLVKSANHNPDPNAMPDPERTMGAVMEAAQVEVTRILRQHGTV